MKPIRQTSLRTPARLSGIGVHSGKPATITLLPADADTGIVFVRPSQAPNSLTSRPVEIPAVYSSVVSTELATILGNHSTTIATAEHVLAALAGLGVDNCRIEIDGPEVPICDGSADEFVAAIDSAGIVALSAPRRYIQILKPVQVAIGSSVGEFRPDPRGFRLELEIDFDHAAIGRQTMALELDPATFRKDIARARTFGLISDLDRLLAAGCAHGASMDNTVVFDDTRVLNPEGLRYADELIRHKILDAVGDLALAGAPILGCYRSVRGGHKLNHAVLSALMADRTAWTYVEFAPAARRRQAGYAELGAGRLVPVFAADRS